jgi:hypothetical protein
LSILKALNPFAFLKFLVSGSSKNKAEYENEKYKEGGKDFVRMVKTKEDYLNAM